MGTRGCIARRTEDGFTGVYHHFDSYPSGLGKALWRAFHGHFNGDLERMEKELIDDHPAGWSTVVEVDWSKPAGYVEYTKRSPDSSYRDFGPQCYCHGDRHEDPGGPLTQANCGGEWVYVLGMVDGRPHMMVLTGSETLGVRSSIWGNIAASLFLDQLEEPNWSAIEKGELVGVRALQDVTDDALIAEAEARGFTIVREPSGSSRWEGP